MLTAAVRAVIRSKTTSRLQYGINYVFKKHFLLSNVCVVTGSAALGDCLQQKYELYHGRMKEFDKTRSRNISLTALVASPVFHYWYIILDKLVPGSGLRIVLKKVVVDSVVFVPVDVVGFLGLMCIWERKSWKDFRTTLTSKAKDLFCAEYLVAAPSAVIRFAFIPLRYRVMFDSTVALGFDYLYSFVYYRREEKNETALDLLMSHPLDDPLVHGSGGHIMKISGRC